MREIKPVNGIIVLKKVEEEERTFGNIIVPDLGKERPELGVVVAVSSTYNWHNGVEKPSDLEVGQTVVIPKMGAMVVSVENEDYMLVKETDVLAIIN